MGARKTESRIPAGLNREDLGQAISSADGHVVSVSFITAPLTSNRENKRLIIKYYICRN